MERWFYGNSVRAWLLCAGTALLGFLVLRLLQRIVGGRLEALAARTSNHVDDLIVELVRGTRAWFLAFAAVYAARSWLTLPPGAARVVTWAMVWALVLQGGLWGNAIVGHVTEHEIRRRVGADGASATTIGGLGIMVRVLLWAALLLVGLDNLGVHVTALVAGLGIGGVAVALAVQSVLGDLFASLSIVLDKPFMVGDFIVVGELAGTVENIGLKTTRVRSLSGEQLIFSNSDLLRSRIRNYKRMSERRAVFGLGVTYDTAPSKVAAIPHMVRAIIETMPQTRFDRAHFKSYGPYSLDFEVVYYVLDPDYNRYMDIQQAINLAILQRFSAEHIEFAFPTQSLYVTPMKAAEGSLQDRGFLSTNSTAIPLP